jgi:hypothetical protein
MRRRAPGAGLALLITLVVTTGCNRGPAEEALAAAEETLAASRVGLPQKDLAAFDRALVEARTALEDGRYTDALRITQDLPSRIHSALDREAQSRAALMEEAAAPPSEPPGVEARRRAHP